MASTDSKKFSKQSDVPANIMELFELARSEGNYTTLYSITDDPLIQSKLIKSYNKEHQKLSQLVDLFYDLLFLFGYERGSSEIQIKRHWKGYNKLDWSFNCYVWTYGADAWVELFKWKTSSFFACIFNACNIPKKPRDCIVYSNPFKLFFGRAQRFLMQMDEKTKKLFANNVLMLKKGAPAVSKSMVMEKKYETYNQLTTRPCSAITGKIVNSSETVVNDVYHLSNIGVDIVSSRTIEFSENRLTHFIDKVVEEVFGNRELSRSTISEFAFPSLSANYNNTRRAGGGLGEIFYQIKDLRAKYRSDLINDDLPLLDLNHPSESG
jgi:hypothetical protein